VIRFLILMMLCSVAQAFETRTELVRLLPVTNGATYSMQTVYSLCQPLSAGEVSDIRYQAEVTNPHPYNIGIGWYIQSWDYLVENGSSTFIRTDIVTPPVSQNVTPAMHHMVISGSYLHRAQFPSGGNTRCYTLVMWAVSSHGAGSVLVEQGYGYLQFLARDRQRKESL
jgi:hypothetical protein